VFLFLYCFCFKKTAYGYAVPSVRPYKPLHARRQQPRWQHRDTEASWQYEYNSSKASGSTFRTSQSSSLPLAFHN